MARAHAAQASWPLCAGQRRRSHLERHVRRALPRALELAGGRCRR
jgi:hypothetical protein